jgi:hypothetical protein
MLYTNIFTGLPTKIFLFFEVTLFYFKNYKAAVNFPATRLFNRKLKKQPKRQGFFYCFVRNNNRFTNELIVSKNEK